MNCSDPNCSFFNGEKCCDLTSTVPKSPPSMIPELDIPEEVDSRPWDAPDDSKKEEIPSQQWVVQNEVSCHRGLNDYEFYGLYCERV